MTIRSATLDDLPAIVEIYNHAILHTTATFDTNVKSVSDQTAWFNTFSPTYPILVAQKENSVVGWASLSPWSDRCAYRDTAEDSVYVAKAYQGQGIGKNLLSDLLTLGKRGGLHTVLARIADGNPISVRMHESFGFQHVGVMCEVGFKFGRRLDVVLMQKIL